MITFAEKEGEVEYREQDLEYNLQSTEYNLPSGWFLLYSLMFISYAVSSLRMAIYSLTLISFAVSFLLSHFSFLLSHLSYMNKLLWLVRLLHMHPDSLTRKDILEAWAEHDDRQRPMPPSTFYDKCTEIERIYGVKVVRNGKHYNLCHNQREGSDLLNFLIGENTDINIEGGIWLKSLHTAIDERRMVRFSYQSVGKSPYSTQLSPYCLRLAQGRCYVVGFSSHHSSVRTFALDRISQLITLHTRFTRPTDFNAARYFRHSIGAFGGETMHPHHVVLQCDEWLTAYLRQRPLHHTQRECESGIFEIDVALTKDFVGILLSFGCSVKIIAPEELRKIVIETAKEIVEKNE